METMKPNTQSESEAETPRSTRRVLVTGDVTIDWNLATIDWRLTKARPKGDPGLGWNSADETRMYGESGRAAVMARLLEEVGKTLVAKKIDVTVVPPDPPDTPLTPTDTSFPHSYVVWTRYLKDPKSEDKKKPTIWRVKEFRGLDQAQPNNDDDTTEKPPPPKSEPESESESNDVDLVLIDDANLGYRLADDRWPSVLGLKAKTEGDRKGPQPWVLLKMAWPVAKGGLWKGLVEKHAERLIVVMTLNDLRLSDMKISRELSWERISFELKREVQRHLAVNRLAQCAYVVVSLGTGGVVLLTRDPAKPLKDLDAPDCHVFFDPEAIENSWADQFPGQMIGYNSCLTTGIAYELLLDPHAPNIHRGIKSGLAAVRALHLRGYGEAGSDPNQAKLRFPTEDMAKVVTDTSDSIAKAFEEQREEPGEFRVAWIPPLEEPDEWSILKGLHSEGLERIAKEVACKGVKVALRGVPIGRFNSFVTVDRWEIEGFRSIRSLLRDYMVKSAPRPRSIAVFGPPGAGKSFGIQAVANSISVPGVLEIEELTFNLSQMHGPKDLVDALHQVRDAGLRGKLPFVLWDEFDSDLDTIPFGWLRHFLVPMQDGVFQQGQILHPIGKAIFVFAGGGSCRLTDFVENFKNPKDKDFKGSKGPDFVSRLEGHVDIVGPDPCKYRDKSDTDFPIRRALLLRSILLRDRPDLVKNNDGVDELAIDPGVLRAFLSVKEYSHGARSLQTIVAMSTLAGKSLYERSALPAAAQLDAHVEAREFLRLVESDV